MERIIKEDFEKMTHEEQLKYWAKNYKTRTEQDITPATEALLKAVENEKFLEETSILSKKICDRKKVNKKTLQKSIILK